MDGRRRRFRIGQVVIAEVALVGVIVASVGPAWLLVGVGAAAAAVGVATFGRTGGRWWYEAVGTRRRFGQRRRRAADDVVAATLAGRTPAELVWLRTLAPELVVRRVTVADASVGVCADGAGWFGAACVEEGVSAGIGVLADLVDLLRPGPDRVAMSAVQMVRCGRQSWLAVRLSPVDAVAAERAAGLGGVEAMVAAGVVRATRLLRKHGYEATALDSEQLLAALAVANGLDAAPQEHWSTWSSGNLEHTTYAASSWPPETLLRRVWAASACLVRAHPPTDEPREHQEKAGEPVVFGAVLIRVAARPGALATACRDVARAAGRARIRLCRLDGDQAPAAYACSPSAVPAQGLARGLGIGLGDQLFDGGALGLDRATAPGH
jgi:hypothetical protein